ncbi:MAG: hypothetical protein UR63_C0037G0010 [Candidatus Roizmanbacteria bacterium GW2011_GWC2_35_12]|uniref:Uncharacterized protein n=1 Tax=Candidatus Roizmanbacteria bacterium GW2011_GWC2_35_12 TaxID=1618485 RepID=A0A0G0BRA3_9BACT|nr:MAG: hypothetical protein UR63_C0037G0010 [Candidatus Roizmanbacteria bacterium GW2011_GWC2_35_12]
MARRYKKRTFNHQDFNKLIFVGVSIAILSFLVLIVKTTSIKKSEPKAQVSAMAYDEACLIKFQATSPYSGYSKYLQTKIKEGVNLNDLYFVSGPPGIYNLLTGGYLGSVTCGNSDYFRFGDVRKDYSSNIVQYRGICCVRKNYIVEANQIRCLTQAGYGLSVRGIFRCKKDCLKADPDNMDSGNLYTEKFVGVKNRCDLYKNSKTVANDGYCCLAP